VIDYGTAVDPTGISPSERDTDSTTGLTPMMGTSFRQSEYKKQLRAYLRITDGIILQPGQWEEHYNAEGLSQADLIPNLDPVDTTRPVLRLWIKGGIASDERPVILLTGFSDKRIISALANTETGSVDPSTYDGANGDFLGPNTFPWASKVILTVPTYYLEELISINDIDSMSLQDNADNYPSYLEIGDALALALSNSRGGSLYSLTENPAASLTLNAESKLTVSLLLEALANDKAIDPTRNVNGDVFKPGFGINVIRQSNGGLIIENSAPNVQSSFNDDSWIDVTGYCSWLWGPFEADASPGPGYGYPVPLSAISPSPDSQSPDYDKRTFVLCPVPSNLTYGSQVSQVKQFIHDSMYDNSSLSPSSSASPRVRIRPRYRWDSDSGTEVMEGFYIRISSAVTYSNNLYSIGNGCLARYKVVSNQISWENYLTLVHSQSPYSLYSSWIGILAHFDPNAVVEGVSLADLNTFLVDTATKVRRVTSDLDAQIWNIEFIKDNESKFIPNGGHWPVYCKISSVGYTDWKPSAITDTEHGLAITAYSIADGINHEIKNLAAQVTGLETGDAASVGTSGRALVVNGCNIDVTAYVTLVDR